MSGTPVAGARRSIDRHLGLAAFGSAVLVIGFGGWAATTEMSGAVLASGNVVVDAHVKKVQHPLGGIVGAIHVTNGQRVSEGDLLISLDPTIARSNLAVITKNLDILAVRQHRLEAERDGRDFASLPAAYAARLGEAELAEALRTELDFFETRRAARSGLRAQLRERISQFDELVSGLREQATAFADGIDLIREELLGLEGLYTRNLVPVTRLMQLKREEAELRGSRAQVLAEIAQTKARVLEARLQSDQIDENLRAEVSGLLSEIQEKRAELVERKVAALDQLERIHLRAPVVGIVHELAVHTIGGVIQDGATLMQIVPDSGDLSIEVRVEVQDRDQIYVGQSAMLRLTAFNQRTTPELKGKVEVVAADLVEDSRTGMRYYPVRISLLDGEKQRLGDKALAPGMPVESFVRTGYRTVVSYLLKPLTDYLVRAFRAD